MSIQTRTHESVPEVESETETTQIDLSAVAGEHTSTNDALPQFDVFHAARQFATDALETAVAEAI